MPGSAGQHTHILHQETGYEKGNEGWPGGGWDVREGWPGGGGM